MARPLLELAPDASIHVVTGAEDVEGLGLPAGVAIVKLPSVRTTGGESESRYPPAGVRALREQALAAAVEIFAPEVLLVDKAPFGLDGELGPALEIVRAAGGRAALGLPDILDEPAAVDLDWRSRGLFARIPDYYDRVLVYGQPDLLDPVLDCAFPDDVARITSFCGYVVSAASAQIPVGRRPRGRPRVPRVLATIGEGDDGFAVLETFVAAAREAGWQATVVTGARCPRERLESIRTQAAEAGISFRHFVPGLLSEFSSLDALVCMGGYNTLGEAAASGVPTVCVPRVERGHDQLIRARAFAARGLLRLIQPDVLVPSVLRAEIEAALAGDSLARRRALDIGGDRRTAHHLLALASQRPRRTARQRALAG